MKKLTGAVALAGLALALAACGNNEPAGAPKEPETFDAQLKVWTDIDVADLLQTGLATPDDEQSIPGVTPCKDSAGGVVGDTEVSVKDADGSIIAIGRTSAGVLGEGSAPATSPCVFAVTVEGVPSGEKFYQVVVGGGAPVTLTEAELRKPTVTVRHGYAG